MTLDGFITFLGLIAAALAIISPVERLQLRLAGRHIVLWSVLFMIAVLYFEFFEAVGLQCPDSFGSWCPTISAKGPITPQQVAFLIVFAWLSILLLAWLRIKPTRKSMPTLEKIVDRLAEAARFADLIDVVDGPIRFIDDCAEGKLPSQLRRQRLVGVPNDDLYRLFIVVDEVDADKRAKGTWRTKVRELASRISTSAKQRLGSMLPADDEARSAADGILQTVLRHPPVVDWIAAHRPRFGARLLSLQTRKIHDFAQRFLAWLIANPSSSLYDEIRNNQNLDRCAYRLETFNPILKALLDDARVAERLEVYQPIGEQPPWR